MLDLTALPKEEITQWLNALIRVAVDTPDTVEYSEHSSFIMRGRTNCVVYNIAGDPYLAQLMGWSLNSIHLVLDGKHTPTRMCEAMAPAALSEYLFWDTYFRREPENAKKRFLIRLATLKHVLENSSLSQFKGWIPIMTADHCWGYYLGWQDDIDAEVDRLSNEGTRIRIDFNSTAEA